MPYRVEKSLARRLAVLVAPECGEILSLFRTNRDGWVKMPADIELLRKNLGIGDIYVHTYEDDNRIWSCLYRGVFPDNTVEELQKLDSEFLALSEEEKLALFNDDAVSSFSEGIDLTWDEIFPKTEEAKAAAKQQFEALSDEEKKKTLYQSAMLIIFFYAHFYNLLSVMVHGQKLTTLVPLALQGNKEAFCKAVQIDRNLLTGHPYFKETYLELQTGEDKDFLDALLYRIGNPTTRSKFRFPALYMLFSTLDMLHWLDEFTASEILDICDEAKLDRFQNRIEDENYLTKRRIEYRRFQRVG
ncbi:MAG TPA: hypothetical protein VK149_06110 [Sideroxyarcus sp.]|nr:hypothetical protein [Sideroxyarcus sp.]